MGLTKVIISTIQRHGVSDEGNGIRSYSDLMRAISLRLVELWLSSVLAAHRLKGSKFWVVAFMHGICPHNDIVSGSMDVLMIK